MIQSCETLGQVLWLQAEGIDCSGAWLRSSADPDASFMSSVAEFGVMEPVLVAQKGDFWTLVSGWKRVSACAQLKTGVPCVSVQGDDLSLARIYLQMNRARFSSGTQALIWARNVGRHVPQEKAEDLWNQELRPLLSAKEWRALRAWLQVDPAFDPVLCQGHVPFELGPVLASLSPEEGRQLLPLFADMAWSFNKARQVVTWAAERARRAGGSVQEVCAECGVWDILNQDLSPKDAQRAVLEHIRAARFPQLTRLEQAFAQAQSQAVGRTSWRILPEQHFESNGLTLQVRVRSQQEAEQVASSLHSVISSLSFTALWNWQDRELDGQNE